MKGHDIEIGRGTATSLTEILIFIKVKIWIKSLFQKHRSLGGLIKQQKKELSYKVRSYTESEINEFFELDNKIAKKLLRLALL